MRIDSEEVYTCMMCKKTFSKYPEHGVCDKCGTHVDMKKSILTVHEEKKMILIKISDEVALESMGKGVFWFQSPKYYQDFVGNDAIGDVNECAFEAILDVPLNQLNKYVNYLPGKIFDVNGNRYRFERVLNGMVYVSSIYQNCFRLLCFYMLQLDDNNKIIKPDEKMKLFGTHFSIIMNRPMLEEKLREYIKSAGYSLAGLGTPVAYVTDKYRGIYTPGCKLKKYDYQNEYRLILESQNFGEMPEKEKKVVNFCTDKMNEIMTKPIEIDKLWTASTLEELMEEGCD